MLVPLNEFICDECSEIIESPKNGYVEWTEIRLENGKTVASDFRIVHHLLSSPIKEIEKSGCYSKKNKCYIMSLDLQYVLDHVHQFLFSFLDLGPFHDPEGMRGSKINNYAEFADFARRLTIPYYEEARKYFGNFEISGESESCIFTEESLKNIINANVE